MTQEEKTRRMNSKELFDKMSKIYPREVSEFRKEFAKASAHKDSAKLLRLMDKYCRMTLKVEPKCELR